MKHMPFSLVNLTCLLVALVLASSLKLRAADDASVEGSLLVVAKGEVEIYHNGKKAVLRDKAENDQHYRAKVPPRAMKAGDVIVLRVFSPYVYRVISAAISLPKKGGQIAVKKQHWRFLGETIDPRKVTAADIQASQAMLAEGDPDGNGELEREKFGFVPQAKNGSDWVKTADRLNRAYCIGFVVTQEMLDALVPLK
jgi:hypothetical protein